MDSTKRIIWFLLISHVLTAQGSSPKAERKSKPEKMPQINVEEVIFFNPHQFQVVSSPKQSLEARTQVAKKCEDLKIDCGLLFVWNDKGLVAEVTMDGHWRQYGTDAEVAEVFFLLFPITVSQDAGVKATRVSGLELQGWYDRPQSSARRAITREEKERGRKKE